MTSRHFPSGRFAVALGYKSRDAAYLALCDMCNQGETSANEAEIESYNASPLPRKTLTRWAITTRY